MRKTLQLKASKGAAATFVITLVCILCLNISTKLFNAMNEATVDTSALLVACPKCNKKTFRTIKKEIEGRGKHEKKSAQRYDTEI